MKRSTSNSAFDFVSAAHQIYRHTAHLGVADSNDQSQMEGKPGMEKDKEQPSIPEPDLHIEWFEPTCQVVQHCLGDAEVLAALGPTQIRQMAEHLEVCSECADVYEAYQEVDAFFASLAHDPPAILVRERIDEWNQAHQPDDDLVAQSARRASDETGGGNEQNELIIDDDAELVGATAHAAYERITAAPRTIPLWSSSSSAAAVASAPRVLISGKRSRLPRYCRLNTPERPEAAALVEGPENVLQAIIQLLLQVCDRTAPLTGGITFTWLLDTLLLEDDHPLWKDWCRAIRMTLDMGWNVRHLIRPTSSVDKVSQFTENMRTFLGATGMYQPFVLPPTSQWRAPSVEAGLSGIGTDFVLISDIGALQLLSPDGKRVTGCRLIPPGDQLATTELALERGIAQAHPVIAGVYQSPSNDYLQAINEIEQHPGARLAVVNGLSETIVPDWIHEKRAGALIHAGQTREQVDDIKAALELELERQHAMLRNLAEYDQIDVCPLAAIDQLVTSGQYQVNDDWSARGAPALTSAQRRAVLRSLIELLKMQPRYQLWLLEDPAAEDDITEFVVKQGYKAMTEFWLADMRDERRRVDLAITEPTIVESLQSSDYWEQLAAHAIRDKATVITVLEERLSMVQM